MFIGALMFRQVSPKTRGLVFICRTAFLRRREEGILDMVPPHPLELTTVSLVRDPMVLLYMTRTTDVA